MPRKYEPQDRRIGAPDYDDILAHQYNDCPEPVTGPGPIPWLSGFHPSKRGQGGSPSQRSSTVGRRKPDRLAPR